MSRRIERSLSPGRGEKVSKVDPVHVQFSSRFTRLLARESRKIFKKCRVIKLFMRPGIAFPRVARFKRGKLNNIRTASARPTFNENTGTNGQWNQLDFAKKSRGRALSSNRWDLRLRVEITRRMKENVLEELGLERKEKICFQILKFNWMRVSSQGEISYRANW